VTGSANFVGNESQLWAEDQAQMNCTVNAGMDRETYIYIGLSLEKFSPGLSPGYGPAEVVGPALSPHQPTHRAGLGWASVGLGLWA